MSTIKRSINTQIEFDNAYDLKVNWDMEIEYDIPEDLHPDYTSNQLQEYRSVYKINTIKAKTDTEVFSIDDILKATGRLKNFQSFIEDKLLEAVKDKSFLEL